MYKIEFWNSIYCKRTILPKMKKVWKLTTEIFIERAVEKHGDKFDYSLVNYTSSRIPVDIICKKCGKTYQQVPAEHLVGKGHWQCSGNCPLTQETFLVKARATHGNKYDYSRSLFVGAKKKVMILCHEHGEFEQQVTAHLMGNGCPKCGFETGSNLKPTNYRRVC